MNKFFSLSFFAGFLTLSLLGCQANKQAKLQESVDGFFIALRREDNNRAISYVQPENQQEFFANLERLDGYRISRLQVDTIFPDEKMEGALVSVNLEFFKESSAELKAIKRYYDWVYLADTKNWFVKETHPFGRESPKPKALPPSR